METLAVLETRTSWEQNFNSTGNNSKDQQIGTMAHYFPHSKGNNSQNEELAYRMGEKSLPTTLLVEK